MIEFQYFEGCPNADETLANVRQLVAEGFISEGELSIVEVSDPRMADELNFQGSPSILVDGVDLATGEKPVSSHFTCRVYSIDGRQTGVLSKDYITARLSLLRSPVD